jgi:hypothetical protein
MQPDFQQQMAAVCSPKHLTMAPVCLHLQEDLALIQRVLQDELMFNIFARLGPYVLGKAACVCKQWRAFAEVRPAATPRAATAAGT